MNKQDLISSNADELKNIEKIFEELVEYIEVSNDAQILQKIQDVTSFLHKSFGDLDFITKNQVNQKSDIYIEQTFKPLSLNVKKALEVVKKFEMVWPDRHGNDAAHSKPPTSNKLAMQVGTPAIDTTTGERLGLYKNTGNKLIKSGPLSSVLDPERVTQAPGEKTEDFLYNNMQDASYTKKPFLKRRGGTNASSKGQSSSQARQPSQASRNSMNDSQMSQSSLSGNVTPKGRSNNKRIIFSDRDEEHRASA